MPRAFLTSWRKAFLAAAGVYCLWSGLLIAQNPGLHYDEAMLVVGAVQMRHSPAEPDLPHAPHTWSCKFHYCVPLMAMETYVGAVKDYVTLPLFALFGARTVIVRLVAMLLALVAIWGAAKLIADQVSVAAGAATALVLAMNPAFVNMTLFDNGAVGPVMAPLGLVAAALSRYLTRRSASAAFWLGAAMGFGVWSRANFVWTLAALGAAAAAVFGRRMLLPVSHWVRIAVGGIAGGAPFLAYQIASKGGTWKALGVFSIQDSLRELFPTRLYMLAEVLLSDSEHRAMWGGRSLAPWQLWLFPAAVAVACALPWIAGKSGPVRTAARFAGIACVVLTATMFVSHLAITEHHLIAIVPFAAAVVVLSAVSIWETHRWTRPIVGALAIAYLGSAIFWNIAAIRGLAATGGIGPWSDGDYRLAQQIRQLNPSREIEVLDWGLELNLYVLLDGQLRAREVFEPTLEDSSNRQLPWAGEIRPGGWFLLNGPEDREFPLPSRGFLRSLAELNPVTRSHTVAQKSGTAYAEIIEVEPGAATAGPRQPLHVTMRMTDPGIDGQLSGLYPVEGGQWRWSKRDFAVTMAASGRADEGARLELKLYLPDANFARLGPVTLTAAIGGGTLGAETYSAPGEHTFHAAVPGEWVAPGPVRIDFSLDKALPPAAPENRELGVVVEEISLLAQ